MRKIKKQWLLFAIAILVAGTMTAYAFVSLTTTTILTVREPLRLLSVGGTFGTAPLTKLLACSIDSSGTVATCTGTAFAGESGTITLQINNFASVSLSVVIGATANPQAGVTVTPPCNSNVIGNPCPVPAFPVPAASVSNNIFVPGELDTQVSVSLANNLAPGPVTITITVNR